MVKDVLDMVKEVLDMVGDPEYQEYSSPCDMYLE